MPKYARIKNNEKIGVFKINGCDSCPFMKFTLKHSIARCKIFNNDKGSEVVDIFVKNFSNKGIITDKIEIPYWCKLPNNLQELYNSDIVYRPFLNNVLESRQDYLEDYDLITPIIDIEYYKNIKDPSMINYLTQFVDKTLYGHNNIYISEKLENEETQENKPNKKNDICSFCGEESDSVNRNINFGMCNNCWEIHKNNKNNLNVSFINNFILKRKNRIVNKPIKYIKII